MKKLDPKLQKEFDDLIIQIKKVINPVGSGYGVPIIYSEKTLIGEKIKNEQNQIEWDYFLKYGEALSFDEIRKFKKSDPKRIEEIIAQYPTHFLEFPVVFTQEDGFITDFKREYLCKWVNQK